MRHAIRYNSPEWLAIVKMIDDVLGAYDLHSDTVYPAREPGNSRADRFTTRAESPGDYRPHNIARPRRQKKRAGG